MKTSPVATRPTWCSVPRAEKGAQTLRLGGGKVYPVHSGDHADGIPHGGGVHVVLDEVLGQDDGSDGQVQEAPGHAGVDDPVRMEAVNEQLGAHGGVYLPDAAQIGQDARLDLVHGYTGHRLQRFGVRAAQHTSDFPLQGIG
jgi:hypothetical protein